MSNKWEAENENKNKNKTTIYRSSLKLRKAGNPNAQLILVALPPTRNN